MSRLYSKLESGVYRIRLFLDNHDMTEESEVPVSEVVGELRDRPSPEAWGNVIHNFIVGTGRFPQAYFAQGILMANAMIEATQKEGMPLSSFFTSEMPSDQIKEQLKAAEEKSHGAYKIIPGPESLNVVGDPMLNIWGSGLHATHQVLENIARRIELYRDTGKMPTGALLDSLQSDSLFIDLVAASKEGLNSDRVKEIAKSYREGISDFMNGRWGDSNSYDEARRHLEQASDQSVGESMNIIKETMVNKAMEKHRSRISGMLFTMDPKELICDPRVSLPNPRRNSDYE